MRKNLLLEGEARGIGKRALAAAAYAALGQTDALKAELVFESAEGIRALNAATRGVDAVTDVLSFPALDGIRGRAVAAAEFPCEVDCGRVFLGSVVICRERAAAQAKEYGHSTERELHYLAAHGLLHLFGYDHMTEGDKRVMRAKEEEIMEKLDLRRDER